MLPYLGGYVHRGQGVPVGRQEHGVQPVFQSLYRPSGPQRRVLVRVDYADAHVAPVPYGMCQDIGFVSAGEEDLLYPGIRHGLYEVLQERFVQHRHSRLRTREREWQETGAFAPDHDDGLPHFGRHIAEHNIPLLNGNGQRYSTLTTFVPTGTSSDEATGRHLARSR